MLQILEVANLSFTHFLSKVFCKPYSVVAMTHFIYYSGLHIWGGGCFCDIGVSMFMIDLVNNATPQL